MMRSTVGLDGRWDLRSGPLLLLIGCLLAGVLGLVAFLAAVFTLPTADVRLTDAMFIEFVTRDVAWFTTAGLMLIVLAYVVVTLPPDPGEWRDPSITAAASVGLAILVATLAGLLAGLITFESVSVGRFLLFAVLTVALGWAYVSLGVAIVVLGRSNGEVLAGVIGAFFVIKYLWDSAIVPMVIAIVVVGDLDRTFIEAPALLDYLLVLSPNGAYAVLGDVIRGAAVGSVHVLGLGALFAWIVLPALGASLLVGREHSR